MKITNRKFLVAGLLASALTFVGCKSDSSAERSGTTEPTQTPPATGTGTDTTGTGTDTTGTGTTPGGTGGAGMTKPPSEKLDCTVVPPSGTGGAGSSGGDISKTKQSDDNLRMPEDDPLRTKDPDTVRQGETEQGVHEGDIISPEPGTGGSGFENDAVDDNLNEGGNVDELRTPSSPEDVVPDGVTDDSSQIPEGTR
jgi:hypothetical protein